jgi:hypothetical protein
MRLIVGFFVLNWPRVDIAVDIKRPRRLGGEVHEKAQGGRGELEIWQLVAGGLADVATSRVVVVPRRIARGPTSLDSAGCHI